MKFHEIIVWNVAKSQYYDKKTILFVILRLENMFSVNKFNLQVAVLIRYDSDVQDFNQLYIFFFLLNSMSCTVFRTCPLN